MMEEIKRPRTNMKIVSWNINGLRSIHKKGFLDWLHKEKADIVCLQEIKVREKDIPEELKNIKGYHSFFNPAVRPGYAGTAVFCKEKPSLVSRGVGFERFDKEGRVIKLKFKDFTLFNFYMVNGGIDLSYKLRSYDFIIKELETERTVLVGDFNIAHKEIDLARPKENKNHLGFTEVERDKISNLIEKGYIDSFREFNKEEGNYTWWAYYRNCRQRNIGWRIDYAFITKDIKLKSVFIEKEVIGSDHAPIGIDITL